MSADRAFILPWKWIGLHTGVILEKEQDTTHYGKVHPENIDRMIVYKTNLKSKHQEALCAPSPGSPG